MFTQEYFHQEVNYKITIILHDSIYKLSGFEEIENANLPDELEFIYFHSCINVFKNNSMAFAKQKLEFNRKRKSFEIESERVYVYL